MLALRGFAAVSLIFSLAEVAVFASLIALMHIRAGESSVISAIAAYTYLLAVPGSLLCAVLGIMFNRRRGTAMVATGIAIICAYLCTTQMLV